MNDYNIYLSTETEKYDLINAVRKAGPGGLYQPRLVPAGNTRIHGPGSLGSMEGRPSDCRPACDLIGTSRRDVRQPGPGGARVIVILAIFLFPILIILELAKKYK